MRSRSHSPMMRNNRVQQSPVMNRRRNESFSDSSPKKVMRRSPSDSPELKPQKPQKSRKRMSPSPSPPPQSRSKQQVQDSDSGSLSPSPPPKKKKKQRRSPSKSPQASDEYDARQYQKPQGGADGSRSKPVKNKKKSNYVQNDNYSSDDY